METVGLIIPTSKRFNKWVNTFGIPNENYIHLADINKSRGRVFSKVLKSKDWYLVDNADDILKDANYRVR
jgi:hypothetical protein